MWGEGEQNCAICVNLRLKPCYAGQILARDWKSLEFLLDRIDMELLKIAVVTNQGTIELSPTAKNVCLYLVNQGHSVDLIIDRLQRDRTFRLPGVRLIRLGSSWYPNLIGRVPRIRRFRSIQGLDRLLFGYRLKRIIHQYDLVFCMGIFALDSVARTGFSLSKVVYQSLEAVQTLSHYQKNLNYVKQLLSDCAFCVIQSRERGEDVEEYLDMVIDFEYLPVSLRPPAFSRSLGAEGINKNSPVQIIYSGYFANWACLTEFLDVCQKLHPAREYRLVLQGHHIRTDSYLETVRSKTAEMKQVAIDTSFYDDDSYIRFLAQFDIGLALYQNLVGSTNWENMIFSSGKIASYLWAGLAVLTNIDHPHTQKPPFLYVDSISTDAIRTAINQYCENKQLYHAAAVEHARRHYNSDRYMDRIMARLVSMTVKQDGMQ